MQTHECPKYSQPMDQGFIVDNSEGSSTLAEWVCGRPQKSFWASGVKVRGKERRKIMTFCCPECGFLESYAKPEEPPEIDPLYRPF
jgi:hypothetical protein